MTRTVQENGVALILQAGDLGGTEIGLLEFLLSYARREDMGSPRADLTTGRDFRGRTGARRDDRDSSVNQRCASQRIRRKVSINGKRAKIVRRERAGTA